MVRRLAAAFAFAMLLCAAPARADGRSDLEKARAAYLARNYTEAEERLRALVDPKTGLREPGLLSQARMNLGATLLAQGKKDAASEVFKGLILEDPTFEPDPLAFPGEVINLYIDIRSQLRERIKQAAEDAARLEAERRAREAAEKKAREEWQKKVEKMAGEEIITARHSRLVACLPFGAGQFQNGQPVLGWIFLGVEGGALAATAVSWPMYRYARIRQKEENDTNDIDRKAAAYGNRADDIELANWIAYGGAAAVAAIGIVQANIAFKSEVVEIKKRELPPISKVTPTIGPAPGGGVFVGLTGATF
ncbi:MAG TPA: hypothetical protein VIF62_34150 [Labilithrix sp.]|jgi:hypothetical protein